MAEKLFCIDFGSAYTKVSLRRGRRTNSEMVLQQTHGTDELKICVPSAVIVDSGGSAPRYTCGVATEARRSSGPIKVWRNWKRDLFLPPQDGAPPVSPPSTRPMTRLEALLHSTAFRQLAESHRITAAEINNLRALVIHATSLTLPIYPTEPAGKPDQSGPTSAQRLADEFFTWLRGVVFSACAALQPAIKNPEELPVRITVPAFDVEANLRQHPGCIRLEAALKRANWKLDSDRPFISEPYANTIGALTQGSNCTRVDDMFRKGLLITALKSPDVQLHSVYRAVVIDVGAFTTDFAVLTLDTGGHIISLSEVDFETRAQSVPVGMSDLDDAVIGALTPEHQQYMRDEAPTSERAKFRESVYLRRKPFDSPAVGEIGGAAERPQIDAAFQAFQTKLREAAEKFFTDVADVPFKELVLTGGGCNFPTIQNTLIDAAEQGRTKFRKVHLPAVRPGIAQRTTTPLQIVTPLSGHLPRGATALGGASAFFDMLS